MYDLSIVIPAFNEEKKISLDIETVYNYFSENLISGELVIVDDGSTDKTKSVAEGFKEKYKTLKVISYGGNKGKGYALKTGILEASGKYILFADSGVCVPYKCSKLGIKLLEEGFDIALGSRRTKDNSAKIVVNQPLYRRVGSKIFYFLIKILNLIPEGILDTQCGFKLFKKDIAHKIYSECKIKGFMIDLEMLRRAHKQKFKIAAFPVEWSNDSDTRYKPLSGSIQNVLQIIKIILTT